jgi:hypothetical protein
MIPIDTRGTDMADEDKVDVRAEYKNRKVGLIIYGVVQILIGGMCALAVPMMVFGMIATAAMGDQMGQQVSARMMIPGLLVYVFAAIWFVWLGIGSLMAKRWARALILVAAWVMLLGGTVGIIFWVLFSPQIYGQMELDPQVPRGMMTIIRHVTTVFMAVIYVILPAAFVLFYRSKHVKATCDELDPKTRWTDRCPLPVLAVVLMFALWSVSILCAASYRFALPFFGRFISGGAGAIVCLALVASCAWTSLNMYRLKLSAWWAGLLVTIAFLSSSILTFSKAELGEYYQLMGLPEEQVALIGQMDWTGPVMVVPMAISGTLFIGYLLYIKRYFADSERTATS